MGGGSKTSTELMTMYRTIMAVVASAGVDVILFYGTLLGFVRGGDFIDGDDDVDVLVSHADLPRLKRAVDATRGLRGVTLGESPRQLYQIFAGSVGPFDIYSYHLINDKTDILVAWEAMIYSALDVFPARRVVFGGYPVLVPQNPHRLLSDTYGSGYMTPMKKGEYVDSAAVRTCHDIRGAIEESTTLALAGTSASGSWVIFLLVSVCAIVCVIFCTPRRK
jgi:hypothetical protein